MPMDKLFTYLNNTTNNKIIDFLDHEIDQLDYLLDNDADLRKHNFLLDYSSSIFIVSKNQSNDSITLN
tara:strand:- start:1028 stop:1231 length:204 start_codon:yes stop_codon:yes gene_type:complete